MKDVTSFRFWSQKILPLVYDESLSYYEVLCKIKKKLDEVIVSVNEQNSNIANFEEDANAYITEQLTVVTREVASEYETQIRTIVEQVYEEEIQTLVEQIVEQELGDYVTEEDLATALTDYVTGSALASVLSNYVSGTALAGELANYVTGTALAGELVNYATISYVNSQIASAIGNAISGSY